METFEGRVTRSRASMKSLLTTPIKQEVVEIDETPFKTPMTSMTLRGRKTLLALSSSKSKIIPRSRSRSSVKKPKVEIKTVDVTDKMKEDCIVPKIVGFMVKPAGQILYGVSIGQGGPVRFVSSEQVKAKIPFAVIDFYEKNCLWKTKKWGNSIEPANMKPTLAICDKNDFNDINNEDVSEGRCTIQ